MAKQPDQPESDNDFIRKKMPKADLLRIQRQRLAAIARWEIKGADKHQRQIETAQWTLARIEEALAVTGQEGGQADDAGSAPPADSATPGVIADVESAMLGSVDITGKVILGDGIVLSDEAKQRLAATGASESETGDVDSSSTLSREEADALRQAPPEVARTIDLLKQGLDLVLGSVKSFETRRESQRSKLILQEIKQLVPTINWAYTTGGESGGGHGMTFLSSGNASDLCVLVVTPDSNLPSDFSTFSHSASVKSDPIGEFSVISVSTDSCTPEYAGLSLIHNIAKRLDLYDSPFTGRRDTSPPETEKNGHGMFAVTAALNEVSGGKHENAMTEIVRDETFESQQDLVNALADPPRFLSITKKLQQCITSTPPQNEREIRTRHSLHYEALVQHLAQLGKIPATTADVGDIDALLDETVRVEWEELAGAEQLPSAEHARQRYSAGLVKVMGLVPDPDPGTSLDEDQWDGMHILQQAKQLDAEHAQWVPTDTNPYINMKQPNDGKKHLPVRLAIATPEQNQGSGLYANEGEISQICFFPAREPNTLGAFMRANDCSEDFAGIVLVSAVATHAGRMLRLTDNGVALPPVEELAGNQESNVRDLIATSTIISLLSQDQFTEDRFAAEADAVIQEHFTDVASIRTMASGEPEQFAQIMQRLYATTSAGPARSSFEARARLFQYSRALAHLIVSREHPDVGAHLAEYNVANNVLSSGMEEDQIVRLAQLDLEQNLNSANATMECYQNGAAMLLENAPARDEAVMLTNDPDPQAILMQVNNLVSQMAWVGTFDCVDGKQKMTPRTGKITNPSFGIATDAMVEAQCSSGGIRPSEVRVLELCIQGTESGQETNHNVIAFPVANVTEFGAGMRLVDSLACSSNIFHHGTIPPFNEMHTERQERLLRSRLGVDAVLSNYFGDAFTAAMDRIAVRAPDRAILHLCLQDEDTCLSFVQTLRRELNIPDPLSQNEASDLVRQLVCSMAFYSSRQEESESAAQANLFDEDVRTFTADSLSDHYNAVSERLFDGDNVEVSDLEVHALSINFYRQALGELDDMDLLGHRQIDDKTEQGYRLAAEGLMSSDEGQRITEAMRTIETCRYRFLREEPPRAESRLAVPDLPAVPTREEQRRSERTHIAWEEEVAHVVGEVVRDLLSETISCGNASSATEVFFTISLSLQRMVTTMVEEYGRNGASAHIDDAEATLTHQFWQSLLHALSREAAAADPIAGQGILMLLGELTKQSHSYATPTEQCKGHLDNRIQNALSENGVYEYVDAACEAHVQGRATNVRKAGLNNRLQRRQEAVTTYVQPQSDHSSVFVSHHPYSGYSHVGCTFAKGDQREDWGVAPFSSSPLSGVDAIPVKGSAVTLRNDGIAGQSATPYCPITNDATSQTRADRIAGRAVSLNATFRRMLMLHAPDLATGVTIIEPLTFVHSGDDVQVICPKADANEFLTLTGGTELPDMDLHTLLEDELNVREMPTGYTLIQLPNLREKQRRLFNVEGIDGELLAGESASADHVPVSLGNGGGNGEALAFKRNIVLSVLIKHDISARWDPDGSSETEREDKDRIPADIEHDRRAVITLPAEPYGNAQLLVSNGAQGTYFIQDAHPAGTYDGLAPSVLEGRYGARLIQCEDEAHFFQKIEGLLLALKAGGRFFPAVQALESYPDQPAFGELEADLDNAIAQHNAAHPSNLRDRETITLSNIRGIRANKTQWNVGVAGCGDTFISGVAVGYHLGTPSARDQIGQLVSHLGIDDNNAETVITGLAARLGITDSEYDDVRRQCIARFGLTEPVEPGDLINALGRAVGTQENDPILTRTQLRHQHKQSALRTMKGEHSPEYRTNADRRAHAAYAAENQLLVAGSAVETRAAVRERMTKGEKGEEG